MAGKPSGGEMRFLTVYEVIIIRDPEDGGLTITFPQEYPSMERIKLPEGWNVRTALCLDFVKTKVYKDDRSIMIHSKRAVHKIEGHGLTTQADCSRCRHTEVSQ